MSIKSTAKQHHQQGRILVIGANGYIGAHLVPALLKSGFRVRASSRDQTQLAKRHWHGVELSQCDVLDKQSLPAALDNIEQVIYLVHSMSEGEGYAQRDLDGAQNLAQAAQQAGVKHILYLGSLTATGTYSTHLRSREQTGHALRSTGLAVTELRAPIVIGPGSAPFEVFRDIVNHLPFMIGPKQLAHQSSPLALADLMFYLLALTDDNPLRGQTLDICGPERISYAQLMRSYADFLGKRFRIFSVSAMPIWFIRWFMPAFTTAPGGIINALLGGLGHDIEAQPDLLLEQFPHQRSDLRQSFALCEQHEAVQQDRLDWHPGNMIFRLHNNRNAFYGEAIHVAHSAKVKGKDVWRELAQIGGQRGYFFWDIFWRARGWIDWLCGGPGMVRYRENPVELFSGERIDTWIIKEASRNKRLLMQFMMRSPGAGCLEFLIDEGEHNTLLTINAYWHPKGFWGRAYWVLFKPAHLFLFHGMIKTLLKLAAKSHTKTQRPDN